MDDLLERIKARIQDPERRVDVRTNVFSQTVQSLDLGQLFSAGRAAAGDLIRVVLANQAGQRLDPDLVARADQIGASMRDMVTPDLGPPLEEASLAAAEAKIGTALPPFIRRLYGEVADGGFGPGGGLLRLADAVDAYLALRADPPAPVGQAWPASLLPLIDYDPGYEAVDLAAGTVISWDPEGLTERSGSNAWQRTFEQIAPSVEAWLETWVGSKTQDEQIQEGMASSMVEEARKARAMIGAMTPEQRAAMGLPEVGWEKVVWGGIGLEDDDPSDRR